MPNPRLRASVADTDLGLSDEDLRLLRQGHDSITFTHSQPQSSVHASTSRHHSHTHASGSKGNNSSNNDNDNNNTRMLDAASLSALGQYLDAHMARIGQRIDALTEQSRHIATVQSQRASNLVDAANAEIARFRNLLRQMDELELDFDRIANVREIVLAQRRRLEELETELRETEAWEAWQHQHQQEGDGDGDDENDRRGERDGYVGPARYDGHSKR